MRLLFDTNVVLDVLLKREPFVTEASILWVANDDGALNGHIAASTLTDIFYITKKIAGLEKARQAVHLCVAAFELCSVDRQTIEEAENLSGEDFEDNVQIACAMLAGLEGIVTRDKRGYDDSAVPAYTPHEIIDLLGLSRHKKIE